MTKKGWKEGTAERLSKVIDLIDGQDSFTVESLEVVIKGWATKNEIGLGQVMNPLRLALVGAPKGPGVFDIMEVLGKEESIRRIQKAIDKLG